MKKEKCCGCLIIKNNKILLVKEYNGSFWGFPKGHVENGESEVETAIRETKEETNLDVRVDDTKRYISKYIVNGNIDKTVVYFKAYPINENIDRELSEIEDIRWCTKKEALDILTYDDSKRIIEEMEWN